MKPRMTTFAAAFLRRLAPLALLVCGVGFAAVTMERATHEGEWRAEARALAQREAELFRAALGRGMEDTLHLAELVADEAALHEDPAGLALRLRGFFLRLAQWRPGLDQVRLIGPEGRERLRVDRRGQGLALTESDDLQDKSQRPYFQAAKALARGAVHLSPLDHNRERGEVELPLKPVIRLAAPVIDATGNLRGVVVLNLLAAPLFQRLDQEEQATGMAVYVHTGQGRLLRGPETDQAWGRLLRDPAEASMAEAFPLAWEAVAAGATSARTAEGFFVSRRLEEGLPAPFTAPGSDDPRLTVHVPAALLRPDWLPEAYATIAGALLLAAFLAWQQTTGSRARERAQSRLVESQKRFAAMGEASVDAMIIMDDRGRAIYWNPAAEKLFGYSAATALGQDVHDLIAPRHLRGDITQGMARFSRTGQGPAVGSLLEYEAKRNDGSSVPVERSVSAFEVEGRWHAVGILRDISERKEALERLEELATTDPLTGLANRRRFLELAGAELDRSRRYGHPMSLMSLDLDRFKAVNDTYGHEAGDLVLKQFALVGLHVVRDVDVFARFGGEEFIILLPETGLEQARTVAERMRRAVAETPTPLVDLATGGPEGTGGDGETGALHVTVSIGLTALTPEDDSLEALLRRADAALYAAKEQGRDRVAVA